MYNFSMPLPFSFELIDDIEQINKDFSIGKVTSLYNCLPGNSPDLSGFEICKDYKEEKLTFEEFSKYVCYAQDKGFEFIYLLNLFKNYNEQNMDSTLDKTSKLIEKLLKIGCTSIRVTSIELSSFINKNFPEMKVYSSTVQEFYSLNQYMNFLETNKYIEQIIPSWNQNKNFKFLKNLKNTFPNVEIELLINEGCRYGCHMRAGHSVQTFDKPVDSERKYELFDYRKNCIGLNSADLLLYICKSRILYPWDLQEYKKIGINKFKFVGRNSPQFANGVYIKLYRTWLLGLENPRILENMHFRLFNHWLVGNASVNYKVKDIKPYLPDIKYFVKNGHLCDSSCGNDCKYCYKKSEQLRKIIEKKEFI